MKRWEKLGGFTLAMAIGCGGTAPSPAAPGDAGPPLSPLAPPSTPFVPPVARPARKAKLLALAPKLDDLFRARVDEIGATGAGVAILLEGEVVYLRGFGVRAGAVERWSGASHVPARLRQRPGRAHAHFRSPNFPRQRRHRSAAASVRGRVRRMTLR